AQRFGLTLRGDAAQPITGVGTLASATNEQLSFLANAQYRAQLAESHAGAVVLRADNADDWRGNCLIAPDPYVAFAKIAKLYEKLPAAVPGVHASSVVAPTARVAAGASIGPLCVVED